MVRAPLYRSKYPGMLTGFWQGIGVSVAEGHGFWVNSVKVGGPAETAGLRKGELLVTIDAKRPRSLGHLRKLLLGPKGTKVSTVRAAGKGLICVGPSLASH